MCKASMKRYYFNHLTKVCMLFTYGGCHGNQNRFETLEECEKTCKPESAEVNQTSAYSKASMKRYYFNHLTNGCMLFTYGGCHGNKKLFETSEECEKMCKPGEPESAKVNQTCAYCTASSSSFSTIFVCTAFGTALLFKVYITQ